MKNRKMIWLLLSLFVLLALTGCIPGDGSISSSNPAGFFWGIWHGWLAPLSLIISLFDKNIRIYETFNSGFWYDFGFYMAIISGFGGLSLYRRKSRRH